MEVCELFDRPASCELRCSICDLRFATDSDGVQTNKFDSTDYQKDWSETPNSDQVGVIILSYL
jgi:organic radical activating enzyme